jgi:hypothetical protein
VEWGEGKCGRIRWLGARVGFLTVDGELGLGWVSEYEIGQPGGVQRYDVVHWVYKKQKEQTARALTGREVGDRSASVGVR